MVARVRGIKEYGVAYITGGEIKNYSTVVQGITKVKLLTTVQSVCMSGIRFLIFLIFPIKLMLQINVSKKIQKD